MSPYNVYVTPEVLAAAKLLPGNVRQRVKRAIDYLQTDPRPPGSKELEYPDKEELAGSGVEVWRLRMDKWRLLYTIREAEKVVDVLAIRRRPPYDYGDLPELLSGLGEGELPTDQ
jgi:mRNA interferase RelE/StbE